jgi:hypothetical protein
MWHESQPQEDVRTNNDTEESLLGPYPPPYGGVATFSSALFEFTKDKGVELWGLDSSATTTKSFARRATEA